MGISDKKVLSIIIPVYNEEDNVKNVIERVKALPIEKEIIVVDDGSQDSSYDILKGVDGIILIHHDRNQGKGAAIRNGLKRASGRYTIIQDADLEYPIEMIPVLYQNIESYDAVYGTRMKGKGRFLLFSYLANRFLSLLTSLLYKKYLSDMETCYKMIRTEILKTLDLKANRFDIEPEITAQLLRSGAVIREIPIPYTGRKRGKKIGPWDGIVAIITLLKYRLMR